MRKKGVEEAKFVRTREIGQKKELEKRSGTLYWIRGCNKDQVCMESWKRNKQKVRIREEKRAE